MPRTCFGCKESVAKSKFSRSQYKKTDNARCKSCVKSGIGSPEPQTRRARPPPPPPPSKAVSDLPPTGQPVLQRKPTVMSSTRVVVVAGPPCAGKGSQCQRLAKQTGYIHLSTGEMVRNLMETGTELANQVKEYVTNGHFVPDELLVAVVLDRLQQDDVKERGCLLDGYPRTPTQAQTLLAAVDVTSCVLLEASNNALLRRAEHRRTDPETGLIYNLKFVPPPDDTVAQRLIVRTGGGDQDASRFRRRLKAYNKYIADVLPCFTEKGIKVARINAELAVEDVQAAIVSEVDFSAPSPASPSSSSDATAQVVDDGWGDEEEDDEKKDDNNGISQQNTGGATVTVEPSTRVPGFGGTANVSVQVTIPSEASMKRSPTDVCCVVDISGSMGAMATYEVDGKVTTDGLSILNLVQHAVKTVMHILNDNDRLSLVVFNGSARTVFGLKKMTEEGRKNAIKQLMDLRPQGRTNIWDGLFHGLESLREKEVVRKETVVKLTPELQSMVARGELSHADAIKIVQFETEQGVNAPDPSSEALPSLRFAAAKELVRQASDSHQVRQKCILLLTDGQPNIQPPQGHEAALRDYMDTHPDLHFQLNTFGFGYDLDSHLLAGLAREGRGTYAFIPDALIVGTTFVNCIANTLSTVSQDATVSLIPKGGASFAGPTLGQLDASEESWGRVVHLGTLQQGQSREVVVPMNIPAGKPQDVYVEAVVTFHTPGGPIDGFRATAIGNSREPSPHALMASLRCKAVDTASMAILKAIAGRGRTGQQMIQALGKELEETKEEGKDNGLTGNAQLEALLADVGGRMEKAFQGQQRFNRWGMHYVRALLRAHQVQLCTNFMDPGLQTYGGEIFKALRDEGDAIFVSLPPPTKTSTPSTGSNHRGGGRNRRNRGANQGNNNNNTPTPTPTRTPTPTPTPPQQMATYYAGSGGGCFGEMCVVQTHTGAHVPIPQIKKGDRVVVATQNGELTHTRVRCLVRIKRSASKRMISLSGVGGGSNLVITPGHPVRVNNEWRLPKDIKEGVSKEFSEDYFVYNLVLETHHILLVNAVECVTWGHGFKDKAVQHPYYGNRVIYDLSAMNGWDQGFVDMGTATGSNKEALHEPLTLPCTVIVC